MEDEDQENEKEDERDGEECKMESRGESKQPLRMKRATLGCKCCETRENVTCEGVLFKCVVLSLAILRRNRLRKSTNSVFSITERIQV